MKRTAIIFILICALLTSCTAPAPAPKTEEPDAPAIEAPAKEPIAEPAPEPTPAPETHETETIIPEVRSNGGYFVGVGDKIWFRHYLDESYDSTVLFAGFTDTESAGESDLWYYDTKGDALVDALPDYGGIGGLWYSGDGFFIRRHNSEGTGLYHLDLDGKIKYWGEYDVCGASDDTRYVAVKGWTDNTCKCAIIKDAKEEIPLAIDSYSVNFAGFAGAHSLWHVDGSIFSADNDTGELIKIGDLPAPEYDIYSAELGEPVVDGDTFYVLLGWYAGTGHFLQDCALLTGNAAEEGSLHEIELSEGSYYERPYLDYNAATKTLSIVEKYDGLVELSEVMDGDLILWTDSENSMTLIENFIPETPYEEGGYFIQCAERIGDAVYMTVAGAVREPEEDIGWRTAYSLTHMTYLRVPVREGAEPEYFFEDGYIVSDMDDVLYAFTGAWVPVVSEAEGDRSPVNASPEDGIFILDNGTITVRLGEYENVFKFTEPMWLGTYTLIGKSDNGETCCCFFNDDYMWCTVCENYGAESSSWSVGCK